MIESITSFFQLTGFSMITWQMLVMWAVVLVLFYCAIYKKFEPLLLVPIAFGALVANLPTRGIISFQTQPDGTMQSGTIHVEASVDASEQAEEGSNVYHIHKVEGGLFDFITQGVKLELFPPLIFLGVGALTDFGPLIANPRMLLLGAAAQIGVFFTFL
ncbi:sodium ion-translocating decarboxylase subunit beta, partial [bacterium]|nr:sodium ion-translocating decarboxylase subunit beta [bacterium]